MAASLIQGLQAAPVHLGQFMAHLMPRDSSTAACFEHCQMVDSVLSEPPEDAEGIHSVKNVRSTDGGRTLVLFRRAVSLEDQAVAPSSALGVSSYEYAKIPKPTFFARPFVFHELMMQLSNNPYEYCEPRVVDDTVVEPGTGAHFFASTASDVQIEPPLYGRDISHFLTYALIIKSMGPAYVRTALNRLEVCLHDTRHHDPALVIEKLMFFAETGYADEVAEILTEGVKAEAHKREYSFSNKALEALLSLNTIRSTYFLKGLVFNQDVHVSLHAAVFFLVSDKENLFRARTGVTREELVDKVISGLRTYPETGDVYVQLCYVRAVFEAVKDFPGGLEAFTGLLAFGELNEAKLLIAHLVLAERRLRFPHADPFAHPDPNVRAALAVSQQIRWAQMPPPPTDMTIALASVISRPPTDGIN